MKSAGVVWIPLGDSIRERLTWLPHAPDGYEEDVFLPFVHSGHTEGKGYSFEASPRNLMLSILMNYSCNAPLLTPGVIQPYMRKVLALLVEAFGMSSLEDLILGGSTAIRSEYGQSMSRIALKTGMDLVPESSAIRSDMIIDTWCRMQNGDRQFWPELAQDVIEAFPDVVLDDEFLVAWQLCVMAYIVALAIRERWDEAEATYVKYKDALEDAEDQSRMEWMLKHRKIDMDRLVQDALGCQ